MLFYILNAPSPITPTASVSTPVSVAFLNVRYFSTHAFNVLKISLQRSLDARNEHVHTWRNLADELVGVGARTIKKVSAGDEHPEAGGIGVVGLA